MKTSNKLFVICTVFVSILLISLNYSAIHDFYVYSVPLNDFIIYQDDSFDIHVWSDTDHTGIQLTVTETNNDSGIFESSVFFTTTNESSGTRF